MIRDAETLNARRDSIRRFVRVALSQPPAPI